jgi:hypothetical protein
VDNGSPVTLSVEKYAYAAVTIGTNGGFLLLVNFGDSITQ